MRLTLQRAFSPNLPPDNVSTTNPQYLNQLKTYYSDAVICPKCKADELIKCMIKELSITPFAFDDLDDITKASLDTSLFSAKDLPLWILPYSEESEIFYRYFHQRFYGKALICILYRRSDDIFVSNCSLMELFMLIHRGLDQIEIQKDTAEFHNYLNSMYLYNEALSKVIK